jgi:transposase InsO family protein
VNVYPFIEAEKQEQRTVKRACELLQVSRSAFYEARTDTRPPRPVEDEQLLELIHDVHQDSKARYGAPRVHAQLRRDGRRTAANASPASCGPVDCMAGHRSGGRRRLLPIRAPLREPTWSVATSPPTRRRSTRVGAATSHAFQPGKGGCIWPPSSTSPHAACSGSRWPTTCAPSSPRTRSPTPSPPATLRPACCFTPTAGCQYTSRDYAALAEDLDVRLSVGRTGQCWDNALAESFFASLKGECLDHRAWPTRASARREIVDYIAWFNGRRLHSALGYLSPNEFEETRRHKALREIA